MRWRLTLDFPLDLVLSQARDELLQVVAGPSTVRSGNDHLGLEAELLRLGGPGGLDGSDGIGQCTVLCVRDNLSIKALARNTHHVEEDTIGGEGGLVGVGDSGRHGDLANGAGLWVCSEVVK